ncbi:MAG: PEP-CTERM sorting domain-containing protein [Proteobacteria bacterium]|nr:MAG: PEP-CTERM sorting domain-containing protein [Pseudomonadota bacterium]
MKQMKLLAVMLTLIFATASLAFGYTDSSKTGFEDLSLSPESYWNGGSVPAGQEVNTGFTSGDSYHNTYKSNFDYGSGPVEYWDGFAYSNRTDTTQTGMAGQYTSVTGSGVGGSEKYGVFYDGGDYGHANQIYFGYESGAYAQTADGMYVTNNMYAYDSMLNGDSFAKRFGYGHYDNNNPGDWDNPLGTDEDWFLLTVYGLDENYDRTASSVEFYLADYRFADNEDDYIVDEWTWMDLSGLGVVYGLEFELSSSDTGPYGMNTPAYAAVDNVPVPGAVWLFVSGLLGLVGFKRRKNV